MIAIRRWSAAVYGRSLHIYRGPDPRCTDCRGEGGYEVILTSPIPEPTYELCDCSQPVRGLRIPLAPRKRRETLEVPF